MNKREEYEKTLKKFENISVSNPITSALIASSVKRHDKCVHKANCGRLLVVAGSVGMTGAAIMASKAAMRCGCGLVTLACAKELNTIFEIALTEVMTCPVSSSNGVLSHDAKDEIKNRASKADSVLIGPGLSCSDQIVSLVSELVAECEIPIILDADGINALQSNPKILSKAKKPIILTPHIGEFSRLISKTSDEVLKNKEQLAKEFAQKYNVVLVLKSHETIVAFPNGAIYRNILGNPGMAKGGSGDVLAGCIASFVAQTGDAELSALAGVYFHSLASDMAVLETGEYSLIPTDTLNCLKYAIKETFDDINGVEE